MTVEPEALADLAQELAGRAGTVVMEMMASAPSSATTKSTRSDVVTEADRAAEQLIVDGILAARPDDGIEGEEGAWRAGSSGVVWHVDPIDGTTNYVYAIPAFSVSIAAAVDDRMMAGVVANPSTGELFRATLGGGATRNGDELACRATDDLATALVATGFGYDGDRRRGQAEVLVEVLPRIRDIRRFGSAALDLCAVATGQVDAYYERGLNRWDLAAGALIAAEAGATVENLAGGPPGADFTLAAGPGIAAELRSLLVDAGAGSGP